MPRVHARLVWFVSALGVLAGSARPERAHAQPSPRPHYALSARLDPEAGVLHGRAHIRWQNRSAAPVRELYFHLYANAFEHRETLFMREGGRRLRGGALERTGGIELRSLELSHRGVRTPLLARAERELWPQDRTQLRVPLEDPLPPGAEIELDVAFELRLPSLLARMGQAGDFFMLGQWYPKLAKHEPDGRWVSFPYHGMGEFYADFADHTLELEVPRGYVIAAPGVPLGASERPDGTRVERYRLDAALDVAWAAYPAFRVERAQAGHVALEVYAPPGHSALARAQLEVLRAGLAKLEARLGRYPHDRLVLVLPPWRGAGAAGMEYPGLIVGNVASWHGSAGAAGAALHDLTTSHELAHQWFPLLIASNELASPVLDEGLSQWLGMDVLRARYGRGSWMARLVGLPFDAFELLRASFARGADVPSSLLPAWRYRHEQLGAAVYARPALVLESLRRTHGEARLWRALGGYARAQRYAHPRLPELLAAFDRAYDPGFGAQVLEPLLAGKGASSELKTVVADGRCETAVLAERIAAGVALPVRVELRNTDGSASERAWPASARSLDLACDPRRAGIAIDPQRRNLLDGARGDDQLRLADRAPQQPWLPRLLLWAQLLLALVGT